MLALVQVTCLTKGIAYKDYFRSAYMWRFGKDISQTSLAEDVDIFERQQLIPPYVVDYVVHCYGTRA